MSTALAVAVPPYDLRERTRLFALAIVKFCRRLPKTDEARETSRQLRRAANSVRSNYRAYRFVSRPAGRSSRIDSNPRGLVEDDANQQRTDERDSPKQTSL